MCVPVCLLNLSWVWVAAVQRVDELWVQLSMHAQNIGDLVLVVAHEAVVARVGCINTGVLRDQVAVGIDSVSGNGVVMLNNRRVVFDNRRVVFDNWCMMSSSLMGIDVISEVKSMVMRIRTIVMRLESMLSLIVCVAMVSISVDCVSMGWVMHWCGVHWLR